MSDDFPDALVDDLRDGGYIDIDRDYDLPDWREHVLARVVSVLRSHGWTVAPPETKESAL